MPNQETSEAQPIHSKVERRERSVVEAVEAIVRNDFFFDSATNQVTLVVKQCLCNPGLPNDGKLDQEISRKVLTPAEIPEEVREKIKTVTEMK